ncbi:Sulfite oxidase [Neonectria ditissima]|uniref:Nitrate reductase [NADPH] n=1 Tax=Neonectria ditissima TaxID=78410 RepID=A0A0P7BW10_9HYPO|nr:Sulfite oxidase [Neonectria ditissima]
MSVFSPTASTARRISHHLAQRPCFSTGLSKAPSRNQGCCRFFSCSAPVKIRNPRASTPVRTPPSTRPGFRGISFIAAASLFLAFSLLHAPPTKCDSPAQRPADGRDPALPRFRIAEVRKHHSKSPNPWVIHNDKVYDITDWIAAHPGGDVILRAAGGSIDPYWDIFTIHKADYVYDILAQYHIGFIDAADLVDGRPAQEEVEDPFSDDPDRNPALITMTAKPRNAETPTDAMTADFLTPNDLFYVRNHMWVPAIPNDPGKHTLTVELEDGSTKEYTLDDLKARFPVHKVTASLQCSGNRRKHMSEGSGRKANGLPWNVGAISNASWEGVLLSDVLADAGFDVAAGVAGTSDSKHVQFSGLEAYGASIPMKKAVDPQGDVLLAYAMNGQPLPRDHGFPLRAVVPGHVAARSVKWLSRITLSDEESLSQWQRRDYKCFGPNQTHVDWETAPAIQEMPVQSAITACRLGEWTRISSEGNQPKFAQKATLSGYAYSGGGRAIVRVDVSLDGGKSWSQAKILPDCTTNDGASSSCFGHGSWAWRRWKYDGMVPIDAFKQVSETADNKREAIKAGTDLPTKARATFVVKATDESYNTQPESHAATWNLRGNLATAWHRLEVCSDCPADVGGGAGTNPDDPYEGWENI